MRPDTDVTLWLDGTPWRGWTDVEISRSIERMGAEGRISMTQSPHDAFLSGALRPGAQAVVDIGDARVLSGYVDAVEQSFSTDGSRAQVRLRDRTGDLVDCAASVDGPFEFPGATLEQVLPRILAPFDIPVRFTAGGGASFARLSIQPGETAYEFIERACRYRALLPVSDGLGGLVLTHPGSERSAGLLRYGFNVLEGSAVLDYGQRFSHYIVKGQSEAFDEMSAQDSSGPEGRALDPLVVRHRPTVIMAETQGYDLSLAQRAQWEMRFARARSARARYVVQGWQATTGTLWQPNTLVRVEDDLRGLRQDMLIAGVSFYKSEQGSTTALDLALPQAFDLPATREDEDQDDPWGAV